MKCRKCGADIPEGDLRCKVCGWEVQIVPDYNPLDEVLTAHVKGSIGGNERTPQKNRRRMNHEQKQLPSEEQKKRYQEMRLQRAKKKRFRLILAILAVLILAGAGSYMIYRNSYAGLISRGNSSLKKERYKIASECFQKAIEKDAEKPEGYTGLAKVYVKQKDLTSAENLFQNAVDKYSSNSKIYKAFIQFYIDTKQKSKIPVLMEACEAVSVLEELSDYIVEQPVFSLESGTYEGEQKLELTTEEKNIFYTLDGEEPTAESTPYGSEITLGEGERTVKAVAVNDKGIPSLVAEAKYTIEAPVTDAPIVKPATGQYDSAMQIEVEVPEGYKAYYTMDNTEPNASSKEYKGPIDMPQGNTIFSVVLVNEKGKMSPVTKRNYDLILSETE